MACAWVGFAGTAASAETLPACLGLEPGPTRTVVRVLDGETLALDDGTELRLIGALAPRAMDVDAEAGAWPIEVAAVGAVRALVLGKSIELRLDGSMAKDRYGRRQAQVLLIGSGRKRWVQGVLLQQGLARAYATAAGGARGCTMDLLAAEQPAREARVGLWSEAAYQVRPADKPTELLRYRATFQVVEGRVIRIGQSRGSLYLNFTRDWRRGFSVSLRRADMAMLGRHAGNPKGLEGRIVRVRGWIAQRGGVPVIDLSAAGGIEVLGE